MKHLNKLKSLLVLGLSMGVSIGWSQVTTFDYTGTVQTYTVPDGISEINIVAYGAQGGSDGGLGAKIEGNFVVTPGEELTIIVGQEGLLQVGGNEQNSSGGGGGSFIYDSSDELFIAAGGGGGRCPYLGAVPLHDNCHGLATENGGESSDGVALGGVAGNGGDAGLFSGSPCAGGGTGWLTVGGGIFGGFNAPTWSGGDPFCGGGGGGCGGYGGFGGGGGGGNHYGGGGGGGGYSGGGGGSDPDHGGGGGSFNGGTDPVNTGGEHTGHGQVVITALLCEELTVTVSETEICAGETILIDAEGAGEITWDGGLVDGEPLMIETAGMYTFTASSDDDGDCGYSVDIEVFELPEVTGSVDESEICVGNSIVLTGGGADDYDWSDGIIDGEAYYPDAGEYTYIVVGVNDETGCENSAEIDVTVYDLPEVIATATDEEICLGESVTLNGDGAATYVWDAEEDGVEFTPTETGTTTYLVTGTDDNGCINEDEIDITVYETIEITYSTIEEILGGDGEINITVTGGNAPYDFDWDNDGLGEWGDDEDLTGLTGGTYTVMVMCEAGCSIEETIELGSQVGIDENNINVQVYPNPTSSNITISLNGTFSYSVTTINGAILLNGSATNSALIDLNEFANGTYFVNVNSEQVTSTKKVMKK